MLCCAISHDKLVKLRRHSITCTIEELTPSKCKWPIGDPQHDEFHFCGGSARGDDSPYCEEHTKMAYRSDKTSQRNKKS